MDTVFTCAKNKGINLNRAENRTKAFTLIELLVVVAIIGILASVGVVAYNGYVETSRATVTKANLNSLVKYVKTEMISCLTESKIYDKKVDCSTIGNAAAKGIALGHATYSYVPSILNFKNPYDNKENAFKSGIAFVKGQTSISGSGNKIQLNTCLKKGCADEDKITSFIVVTVD